MQADAAAVIAAQSPAAYWDGSFSGGALLDVAGGGINATAVGFPLTGQVGADLSTGSAVDCGGSVGSDYFVTAADPLGGSPWDYWSMTAWVYAYSAPAGNMVMCDALGFDGSVAGMLGCGVDYTGSDVPGGAHESFSSRAAVMDFASISITSWVHLAVTFDVVNGWTFYRDGTQVGSASFFVTSGLVGEWFYIGNTDNASGGLVAGWPGLIDQPAVFPFALSGVQVQDQVDAMNLPASGGLSVSMSGLASAFTTGTAVLKQNVSGAGVASGAAAGAAALQQNVSPTGVATSEAEGTGTVSTAAAALSVSPAGVGTGELEGTPALQQTVSSAGAVGTGEAEGTPVALLSVTGQGVASSEAEGVAALQQNVNGTGTGSGFGDGTGTVTGGTPATIGSRLPSMGVG